MQYWKTHQKDIILEKLESTLEKKIPLTMWQQFGSHRYSYKATLVSVSKQLCQLNIDQNSEHIDKFDPEKQIFVHIPIHELIFKKESYNRHGHLLEFSMPGDIQVYEKRKTKRYYYLYQDHKSITYHSESLDPASQKPSFTDTAVLVDISVAGAGMVVGPEQIQNIKVGIISF